MTRHLADIALLVVDIQRGFDDVEYWGRRDNPDCERNAGILIAAWREAGEPVVFVRHDSTQASSPLRRGQQGNEFKDVVTGDPDLLVVKQVNSALLGEPHLGDWLDRRGLRRIAICGISTNHCCETTARMGANLGYEILFALDATHSFDRQGPAGETVRAEELAKVTATNLHGEFAEIVSTAGLVHALGQLLPGHGQPTPGALEPTYR